MTQKLELTRVGKNKELKLEPRVLVENPELSYGDKNTENMLIHGDNLLALKALEQEYTGKIKCIYIDPPYNTGNAFEHYDDGLEHSEWLNLMKPRLVILRNLLSDDGSIRISIDDDECHYLKILCDEVFGRRNFINNVIREKKFSPQNDAKRLSDNHDHILCYAKDKIIWRPNLLPRTEEMDSRYKNPDNDLRGARTSGDISVKRITEKDIYPVITPSGRKVFPPAGSSWRLSKEKMEEYINDNRIRFGSDGSNVPRIKRFLSEVKDGITSLTIWGYQEVGHNQDAKKEVKIINSNDIFDTPKPEKLMQKIIHLGSKEGDIILDSFLGSGTATAVAHKMGRKRIGIELENHAYTHCKLRMDKVINGDDGLKLSNELGREGGGGYKFYELGPSLLAKDQYGNFVINPKVNGLLLIQALCKIENFTYRSFEGGFKHGFSTEKDFIHVTTRHITQDIIDEITERYLKDGETLLMMCKTYTSKLDLPDSIQVKKIPLEVMSKCEYGDDVDYSLPILSDNENEDNE